MDPKEILPLIPIDMYDPSEVILIGSHMYPYPDTDTKGLSAADADALTNNNLCTGKMLVRSDFAFELELKASAKKITDNDGTTVETVPTMALIYAYGYEGHTYRLSKPRIMIVQGIGSAYEEAVEGASASTSGKLFMWRMSKHQQTISIEVESGELEKLVLEANQPGNRAVNSYAAHMQMSHRGGKLS